MIIILFFVLLSVDVSWQTISNEDGIQWSWKCNSLTQLCEKQFASPTSTLETAYFNNLPLCRLTCGKYGALWPRPTIFTSLGTRVIPISLESIDFEINAQNEAKDFLKEVTNIFLQNLQSECEDACANTYDTKITIAIGVDSGNLNFLWHTNESYSLIVATKDNDVRVDILSPTVFGARHALETLLQLTTVSEFYESSRAIVKGLVMVAEAKIQDRPVYTHRGLLIDTSRNYLTISDIQRQIDGMAASKLNILHWHMTDSQSFPFESQRVPQLSKFGAYSPDKIYKMIDIKELLKYAKYRGVRIIIEIDAPSHAGNGWQWGDRYDLGDLVVCFEKQPWRNFCIQPPCGQMNPINPYLYQVLENLYRDIVELFPKGEVIHMGGDEVFIPCWNSVPEILNYLKEHSKAPTNENFLELWANFQEKNKQAFDTAAGNSTSPIMLWTSGLTEPNIIEKYLSNSRYVIQTWVPGSNALPQQLLEKGYQLVISTKDAWYLDHGFWGRTKYYTWHTVFNNRISREKGVLGGEVCMWGEYVDGNTLDGKIWPRAAAFAERMWTNPDENAQKVEVRFYRHRERLVTRGIKADAVAPYWCYQNEGQCF